MIGRADSVTRVREWGLREDVVEKDYVLGWTLWGIGTDPELGARWAFKGGTCLKKCYIETYRFSEDLDFTVLPGLATTEETVTAALVRVLQRTGEVSGIDFSVRPPLLRLRPDGTSLEGRIYYRGPRAAPEAASIKIDLSLAEVVARPPVLRRISHPYPDALPEPASVRCYSFDEVFAEKIRAMGERGRPRDLYDIVNLYWRSDLRAHGPLIRATLDEKCRSKGVPVPTLEALEGASTRAGLESEWANMLGHQLPALPPFASFWSEVPALLAWLEGTADGDGLVPIAAAADDDMSWSPPPTVSVWRSVVPLEPIRFAASNRLCVELGYHGSVRVIEPYSLRRTRDGHFLLHALRVDGHEHRSYRVDQIQSARVTTRPFRPVYRVEFSESGPLAAPPPRDARGATPARHRPGPTYVVECASCGRTFRHATRTTALHPHLDVDGSRCYGRRGSLIDEAYL
ncbi:MAG: nucleotidyl transferase AbiEii/AbiGii toxin family protein [Chloroflexota bacterium]